jgi:MscS family membrane protein
MQRIRMNLAISLETPADKIQGLISKISSFLEQQNEITNDFTVKFFEINNTIGFEILIIYFVNTTSYDESLEVKEKVNFKLLEILKEEEINLTINNYFSSTNGDKK